MGVVQPTCASGILCDRLASSTGALRPWHVRLSRSRSKDHPPDRSGNWVSRRRGIAAGFGTYLPSLQKPSAFVYRRHRLFDSRHPRRRLLGRGKVKEVTPLTPRRQRLEGALETRVSSEPLRQFLGNRKVGCLFLL